MEYTETGFPKLPESFLKRRLSDPQSITKVSKQQRRRAAQRPLVGPDPTTAAKSGLDCAVVLTSVDGKRKRAPDQAASVIASVKSQEVVSATAVSEAAHSQGDRLPASSIDPDEVIGIDLAACTPGRDASDSVVSQLCTAIRTQLNRVSTMILTAEKQIGKEVAHQRLSKQGREAIAQPLDLARGNAASASVLMTQLEKVCESLPTIQTMFVEAKKDIAQMHETAFAQVCARVQDVRDAVVSRSGPSAGGPSGVPSYASCLKLSSKVAPPLAAQRLRPSSSVTMVFPKTLEGTEKASSQKLVADLKASVKLSTQGVTVNAVREIRGGGILIAAPRGPATDKLRQFPFFADPKLQIRTSEGRQPRVLVYDVPATMVQEEFLEALYSQNLADCPPIDFAEFTNTTRLLFKTGPRDKETVNWVFSCHPLVRERLVTAGRISLEWNRCRVRDYAGVTRCYQCQRFGHTAQHCRSKQTCGHCAQEGHNIKSCTSLTTPPKCSNCSRFGRPAAHAVTDQACPAYVRSLEEELKRTDYGV